MAQEKLTESDASRAYAKTINTLDTTPLMPLLADDACYVAQNVFDELKGKDEISDYLSETFKQSRRSKDMNLFAELALTRAYTFYAKNGEPCVRLAVGDKDNAVAVVLFEIKDDRIQKIEFCTFIPDPSTVERTGEYPA